MHNMIAIPNRTFILFLQKYAQRGGPEFFFVVNIQVSSSLELLTLILTLQLSSLKIISSTLHSSLVPPDITWHFIT